jgi:hypothetical protein
MYELALVQQLLRRYPRPLHVVQAGLGHIQTSPTVAINTTLVPKTFCNLGQHKAMDAEPAQATKMVLITDYLTYL